MSHIRVKGIRYKKVISHSCFKCDFKNIEVCPQSLNLLDCGDIKDDKHNIQQYVLIKDMLIENLKNL